MNYWDANFSFRDYNMIGLSGGGWTTTVLPALDPRIKISIPVAGSWPGIIFAAPLACAGYICGDSCETVACAEQNWTNFFTVAGYIDLYMMASYGPNRRQFQILNYSDNCCFGNSSFVGSGAASFYGVDFPTYIGNYIVRVKQKGSGRNASPLRWHDRLCRRPAPDLAARAVGDSFDTWEHRARRAGGGGDCSNVVGTQGGGG